MTLLSLSVAFQIAERAEKIIAHPEARVESNRIESKCICYFYCLVGFHGGLPLDAYLPVLAGLAWPPITSHFSSAHLRSRSRSFELILKKSYKNQINSLSFHLPACLPTRPTSWLAAYLPVRAHGTAQSCELYTFQVD